MKVRAKLAIRHTIGDGADVVREEVLEFDGDDIERMMEGGWMYDSPLEAAYALAREHMQGYVEIRHEIVEE